MNVYRLSKSEYINDLSGKGAQLTGGRWNSKGTAMLYTSHSRALCTAELAVHTATGNLPAGYRLAIIDIPDEIPIEEIKYDQLPNDWRSFPHPDSTQKIGDQFIKQNKFPVLKVPSAVVPGDFNYLINPAHRDSIKIKIIAHEPFEFDTRLFG